FKSKNLTCDVINSLKNLLNDENISNIPEILNFVDNKTLSTDVKEEIIGEIVNGEYIENSYYVFLTTEFKNDVVYEKEIKILKSKTSELEDFDNSDLNSLINCYKTNKDKFVSYTYNECQPNVVNIIFKSLNQQNEQEKNLE
ncbi:MAG: hypothetical protein J5779_02700, partial [Clostridia bacterium]|nr:hypothetical protein [Clostridia bacterium]